VAGTSGDASQPNVHAAWRMAQARRAAQAYQPNPKLAALAVAGSVGSGLADQFSDLELDCYWFSAPGNQDRTGPIDALGGDLTALWDYDPARRHRSGQAQAPGRAAALVPAARRGADGVLAVAGRRIPGRARLGHGGTSAEPPDARRLAERLELLSAARHPEALQAAEGLLTDIVLLSEARTGADLGSFREELSGRRRAIGPPPG